MNSPKKRFFQFGLRTLLLIVLLCAIGMQVYMNDRNKIENLAKLLAAGMSPDEVHAVMGLPTTTFERGRKANRRGGVDESWWEEYSQGRKTIDYHADVIVSMFYVNDRLVWAGAFRPGDVQGRTIIRY